MATNTHIPVRGARRCILRSAASKFLFATAVATAAFAALASLGALKAAPEAAFATAPAAVHVQSSGGDRHPPPPRRPPAPTPRDVHHPPRPAPRSPPPLAPPSRRPR